MLVLHSLMLAGLLVQAPTLQTSDPMVAQFAAADAVTKRRILA
jgi:hypothetical protein